MESMRNWFEDVGVGWAINIVFFGSAALALFTGAFAWMIAGILICLAMFAFAEG